MTEGEYRRACIEWVGLAASYNYLLFRSFEGKTEVLEALNAKIAELHTAIMAYRGATNV